MELWFHLIDKMLFLHYAHISIIYANPMPISMDNFELASLLELIVNGFHFVLLQYDCQKRNWEISSIHK